MPLKVTIENRPMRDRLKDQLTLARAQIADMAANPPEAGTAARVHFRNLLSAQRGNVRDLARSISDWDKANPIPKPPRRNRRGGGRPPVEGQDSDGVAKRRAGRKPSPVRGD